MKPFFSIVIPVYNCKEFLLKCLDSVRSQDFVDWECICVDDGSVDGSAGVLDDYALKDSRFKVLHQKNKGVSEARNLGIEVSTGDWISFVDADDFLARDYYRLIHELILVNPDVDVAMIRLSAREQNGDMHVLHPYQTSRVVEGDITAVAQNEPTGWMSSVMVDKICRRDLFVRCHIHFEPGMQSGEDTLCAMQVLAYAKRMVIDASVDGYYYRFHDGSLNHSKETLKKVLDRFAFPLRLIQLYEAVGFHSVLVLAEHWCGNIFFAGRTLSWRDKKRFADQIMKRGEMREVILPFMRANGNLKMRVFAIVIQLLPNWMSEIVVLSLQFL